MLQRLTTVATGRSIPDLSVIHLSIVRFMFFLSENSLVVVFPALLMVVQKVNQM